ncbi:MAG: ATP-dependent DNA helicase RecG [Myxococcota bacterium]
MKQFRGVGAKTVERLQERGITDAAELLLFIPRKYRPVQRYTPAAAIFDARATHIEILGEITNITTPPSHSRAPVEVLVSRDGREFKLIWFNMNRRGFTRMFQPGKWMRIEGKVDWERGIPTMAHPTFDMLGKTTPSEPQPQVVLEPVYRSMEGIPEATVRSAILDAIHNILPSAVDVVPERLRKQRDLPTVQEALETIHVAYEIEGVDAFRDELTRARHRLVYEEFWTLQRKLTEDYVRERRSASAHRCEERELGRALVRQLPFKLTGDQNDAIGTIADDLAARAPMRRLLQGDVGSGKTVVAFMAAAICIGSGQQVAMMAPTDILAKQHLRTARDVFDGLDVNIGLLTGSLGAADKRAVLAGLRGEPSESENTDLFDDGDTKIDLVIGTHALFQDDVEFDALAMLIVDEQHKFGVEQREALLAKGRDPHLLAMTATPIPRSLAHAVFGDLDLTVIREKPPGRKPIRTFLRDRSAAPKVYKYVRDRVVETGEQAYFVYPMVEASEAVAGRKNVTDSAAALANGPLAGLQVGILHGRMDDEAKDQTMQRFARGEIQVLCATTVVEVGVDVANATIMVIESPEVFGLSQLHQLRGRVGRGSADSMCILLAGYALTDDAEERLNSFSGTEDGFDLAEIDLQIRGPGEFLGVRQSGLAEFRFGDVLRDSQLIEWARVDARRELLGDAGG